MARPADSTSLEKLVRDRGSDLPKVGDWYWLPLRDEESEDARWLGCVTEVGSNYYGFVGVVNSHGRRTTRIHFDNFDPTVHEREPDAEAVIASHIAKYDTEVRTLIQEVTELTARLSVSSTAPQQETQALALRNEESSKAMTTYKLDLIKARDKTLPDLFKQIEEANSCMAGWMKAKLIPLESKIGDLKEAKSKIEERIFSVELYAGLVEQVHQIRDGEPAGKETPIHLMQRRCYMDEECLANYKAGGMEFKDIKEFDRWLAKKENFDRVLPHPRCLVAFQVRRNEKVRHFNGFRSFITFVLNGEARYDKFTYLYIRNGDQLYRLATEYDFDAQLFPDPDKQIFFSTGEKIWAKQFAGNFDEDEFITDAHYKELIAEDKAKKKKDKHHWSRMDKYEPFTSESVYFDDMARVVTKKIKKHNNLVLILQGLLDRSPVLHPHPVWHLWTREGFEAALKLVHDSSRALVSGDAPDFEAYRARLNASLKVGCMTVGQEEMWLRDEARKYNEREEGNWRRKREHYHVEHHQPYGNPGPGLIAKTVRVSRDKTKCSYTWTRERQIRRSWSTGDEDITCHFTTEMSQLLNVEAYTPGDYKIFYADPRTRAMYIDWAPLLLAAEDWHAKK